MNNQTAKLLYSKDLTSLNEILKSKPEGANYFDFLSFNYINYLEDEPTFSLLVGTGVIRVDFDPYLFNHFASIADIRQAVVDRTLLNKFGGVHNLKKHHESLVAHHNKFDVKLSDNLVAQLKQMEDIVKLIENVVQGEYLNKGFRHAKS